MISLPSLIHLHFDAKKDSFGIGNNLLAYLARPRLRRLNNFNYQTCYESLLQRLPADQAEGLNIASQDTTIFLNRFRAITTDIEYYRLAVKENPTVEDLEKASYRYYGYSYLWPIKEYLLHHMSLAKDYRGLVPFGGPVKLYFNHLKLVPWKTENETPWEVKGTPTFQDHIMLQQVTNDMADALNLPSITVNNIMYLYGKKMKKDGDTDEQT